MKIINVGNAFVTLELTPADCFLLAEACDSVAVDHTTNVTLMEALPAALTAAGMAAAARWDGAGDDYTLDSVREHWLPADDRRASAPPVGEPTQ